MLIKHALKTGIAAAILAGIFQNSDLAHVQYPAMGLVSTMLSSNLGGNLKAAWGRLGGSVVAGLFSASLISTFSISPFTGGVAFIISSLFCEIYQLKVLTAQAGIMAALIAADPSLGQYPWQYTFNRVVDNGIGVAIATAVTILFWPDNPRQTLRNHLVRVLQNCARLFTTIIERSLSRDSKAETDASIAEMAEIVRQSESLLEQSLYGFAGRQLTQNNWSDLIATEDRLCRQLAMMTHTFKGEQQNHLLCNLTEDLEHLAQQVWITCHVMTSCIQSETEGIREIPILEGCLQKITDRIDRMRMTGAIKTYTLDDILQVYNFLNLLTRFTQVLDGLAIALRERQKTASQPLHWSFQHYPIPVKQVKHIIKTGVAFGLTMAIVDFAQLPLGFVAPMIVIINLQPTLGKSISTSKQTAICLGIGALVAFLLVNSLGNNPILLGLGVGLTILICTSFGFERGYIVACFLIIYAVMMSGTKLSNPFIWEYFSEALLGVVIALIFSLLFWRETASQTLEREIAQTLVKLGTLYEIVVNHYWQGLDSRAITAQLNKEIQQSIQNQTLLQAETQQESVYAFMASKTQRKWNFLLSYEKSLLNNILSLQSAAGLGNSKGISQFLHRELQTSAYLTVLGFKDLAQAVGSQFSQRHLAILLSSFDVVEQQIEPQQMLNSSYQYNLEDAITFLSVISTMKEISLDLNQMAQDWPKTQNVNSVS